MTHYTTISYHKLIFLCINSLLISDVCLKDTMSVADSLYNLQLIREFCGSSLQSSCPLAVEDLLYAPPVLHVSIPSSHIHTVRERYMDGNVLAHCFLWVMDAWYCWLNFFDLVLTHLGGFPCSIHLLFMVTRHAFFLS